MVHLYATKFSNVDIDDFPPATILSEGFQPSAGVFLVFVVHMACSFAHNSLFLLVIHTVELDSHLYIHDAGFVTRSNNCFISSWNTLPQAHAFN